MSDRAEPPDQAALVDRARRGDRRAFGDLVRQNQRRVYATALHITGNHADADDVAQEAFVRAFRGLKAFDGRAELATWLYRITVNTALNHLRSKKRARTLQEAGEREVEARGGRPEDARDVATPREWSQLSEELAAVLTGVMGLSPTLRVTLVLATVHGKSYREIAELLEIPEGTVAWRVSEARSQLRQLLDDGETEDRKVGA